MTWKFSRLLRPFLQVGFIWVALGTSVSRISDYKHHPSDVLTGALLGVTVAVLTVKHFMFCKYNCERTDLLQLSLGPENLKKWEGIFQSGNFKQTGKDRENHKKYWKSQGI